MSTEQSKCGVRMSAKPHIDIQCTLPAGHQGDHQEQSPGVTVHWPQRVPSGFQTAGSSS